MHRRQWRRRRIVGVEFGLRTFWNWCGVVAHGKQWWLRRLWRIEGEVAKERKRKEVLEEIGERRKKKNLENESCGLELAVVAVLLVTLALVTFGSHLYVTCSCTLAFQFVDYRLTSLHFGSRSYC
ncbi:uncharacterized protein LOC127096675 isoform X1 [Lathyrus oleraceus]|uniref:uncharacterized protein LOC127096675 isoform X1 n=1 Tax=Pisum sativum TaxID=3888 RepID=UPI0021D1678C|nr:uncharacterized protein LOC127096675 isoform X1 [Pisum sativum]